MGQTWAVAASLSAPLHRPPSCDRSGISEVSFSSLHWARYLPQPLVRLLRTACRLTLAHFSPLLPHLLLATPSSLGPDTLATPGFPDA